ncbi:hypothetical protein H5399_16415 [Tessaracoccus sp. MC1627]|uniref:hypothetical protein n=1 Tax=Tessaracoccus sp. MC1627 TaxID=2760312 RepID=UPI00160259C4|nr:hypothetical protein [Tessaracoccus sp. MC1627]MBB1514171.1 hypothetical protein [Tessaracoccus sp. MC1627]
MLALYSYLTATLHTHTTRVRDQRGLSQSTENAILLAGAVGIAVLIISAITAYVQANLPS